LPDYVRRRIQALSFCSNSPLNGPFSKFPSDDPREFPATGVVANSLADDLTASLAKSAPLFLGFNDQYRN
jgi:hypothetical protein